MWSLFVYLFSTLVTFLSLRFIWRRFPGWLRRTMGTLAVLGLITCSASLFLTARGLFFQQAEPHTIEEQHLEDKTEANRLAVSSLDQRLADTNRRVDDMGTRMDGISVAMGRMDAKLSLMGELFFGAMIPLLVVVFDVLLRWMKRVPERT